MRVPIFQIDAFAERLFEGNPAAVCPLERWPDDRLLQWIAQENNLSETAFFVPSARGFQLRWFTPLREVEMCGHATLATAHVLFEELGYAQAEIVFETLSGDLKVVREDGRLVLDFPARAPVPCAPPAGMAVALGAVPHRVLAADDYVAVFTTEQEVRGLRPDFRALAQLDRRGVIATAPSAEFDFVCRFFAPRYGIDEDPVTGSAYTELAPFWARQLGKRRLVARQVSARGGTVFCAPAGDRVRIGGSAVKYLEGALQIAP